ncbi:MULTISPECIES: hypothetical protein [unclassified Microbacterium]|uniref:hypothetical protein n=1 Tax=unclassified Microbacterium TaxID=2609290 RepID=UPI000CFF21BA|nr:MULTISPECIES: hypothetical protein [unclassified Microbacterium]PRB63336.1 hypothetical protein CQ021_16655 [Microbacterium sp. MYb24]
MSHAISQYDEHYSPTCPVGMVRARRTSYLAPHPGAGSAWERYEAADPSSGTVVDPAYEDKAAKLLLDYYEAVRRDRRIYRVALAASVFGLGGLGVLAGWLADNYLISVVGVMLGVITGWLLLTGSITLPEKAATAQRVLASSGLFRDRTVLAGYLITTRSSTAIWEATELEQQASRPTMRPCACAATAT